MRAKPLCACCGRAGRTLCSPLLSHHLVRKSKKIGKIIWEISDRYKSLRNFIAFLRLSCNHCFAFWGFQKVVLLTHCKCYCILLFLFPSEWRWLKIGFCIFRMKRSFGMHQVTCWGESCENIQWIMDRAITSNKKKNSRVYSVNG